MKKARVIAVCTVGLVLALLLGGSGVDKAAVAIVKDSTFIQAASPQPVLGESQGVVLDLAWAKRWTFNGESLWFVPVPHSDIPWQPLVVNPMHPSERLAVPESLMRRSLWFMPVGERLLWGTLFRNDGPALVFAERLSLDDYRLTVENLQGQKLAVAEGTLRLLNEKMGLGLLEPKPVMEGKCACKAKCFVVLWTAWCDCSIDCDLSCLGGS